MAHVFDQLDEEALACFRSEGFVGIDGCIDRALCERWVRDSLAHEGIDLATPATWPQTLKRVPGSGRVVDFSELSPKAWQIAATLVGGDERLVRPVALGDTLVLNCDVGSDPASWRSPTEQRYGWHIDGDYNHFLDSPECGILVLILFTDVQVRGGATWICPEGLALSQRLMRERPYGISGRELQTAIDYSDRCSRFIPLDGPAGRVYFTHPSMPHSASLNVMRCARAIINMNLPLRDPMRFDPSQRPLSEVESLTLRLLGVERLDLAAPTPDLRFPTDHDTGAPLPRKPAISDEARRARITTPVSELASLAAAPT